MSRDKNIKQFDFDKLKGNLRIRNRKMEIDLYPFGMSGYKKIKDYFIDNKIPRDMRDKIPLLVDDENIIWIVGYAMSDLYKVSADTKNTLLIKCKKI